MTRVLVVDDHEENRVYVEAMLSGYGCEVSCARNGAEALEMARQAPPDVVVSDLLMPVMDGYTLLRLWKADEALRRAPFVVYTATYTEPEDERLALDLGADAFLVKPLEPEPFWTRLRQVLGAVSQGAVPDPRTPTAAPEAVLDQYSRTLVRKLEKRSTQLEEANRLLEESNARLELDIVQRTRAEDALRELSEELERRVRERTAQLAAANEELEAFAYSVSHDLRAPLRAIDGYSAILVEDHADKLGGEGARLCAVVRDRAKTMGLMIDELLQLSRVSRAELEPVRLEMAPLVRAAYLEVTSDADRGRIDFSVGDLPAAFADPRLLSHVWTNLLDNAVKFSSRRERAVIGVRGETRDGEVVYSVSDDGAGFDMRYADGLFDAFRRLHRDDEFVGTGAGLSIVRRVVVRHGGRVWAQAEVDRGATFFFTLPAV